MKKWAFDGPLMSFAFDRGGVVGSEKNIFWICALTPQISLSRSEPHAGYEAPSRARESDLLPRSRIFGGPTFLVAASN